MNEEKLVQRLLALHYVYPVSLNKLSPILKEDPELDFVEKMSILQLSHVLNLTYEKAKRLQTSYLRALETPFLQAYEKHQITPIYFFHPLYPTSLLELFDPPAVLYAKGEPQLLLNNRKVAIIGSRKATSYSLRAMEQIIPPLVQNDYVIVSGLAKGADTMAHKATINYGGKTIAILGHGLFHLYPKENESLSVLIGNQHLLLTEYPPYVTPKKWYFPMRNRIISGISSGVVVTEAAAKSGTVSTMEHALDHGKDIFVVPGPITSELSQGPNKLLIEGAIPVWNGSQIIQEIEGFKIIK